MEITKVAIHYNTKEDFDFAVLGIMSVNFNTPSLELDHNQGYIYFSWSQAFKYQGSLRNYSGIYEYFPISNTYVRLDNSTVDIIAMLSSFVALDNRFLVLLGSDNKSLDVYSLEGLKRETDPLFSYIISVTFNELVEGDGNWHDKYFDPLVRKYPHLIFNNDD